MWLEYINIWISRFFAQENCFELWIFLSLMAPQATCEIHLCYCRGLAAIGVKSCWATEKYHQK